MKFPRVYPIVDTCSLQRRGWPVAAFAAELLDGGAEVLQFRHKEAWTRSTLTLLEEVVSLCRRLGCKCFVNDRADFAALFDTGLHVGQDDLLPSMARRVIGPERRLGFSTHNAGQLLAADGEPADYLALGPIFGTVSKANPDPVVGLEALRRLRPLTNKPLVAIGGITRETAAEVLDAGADSIALIGDLIPEQQSPGSVRARMEAWRKATT